MDTKDLALLILIPLILISLVVYINNEPVITGAVTAKEEVKTLGIYSVGPSFKIKINYDLQSDYESIKEKFDRMIEYCKNRQDIEECIKSKSKDWECAEDGIISVLFDFTDKFNDCKNIKDGNAMCRFSLENKEFEDPKKRIEIEIANWYSSIKTDLKIDNRILNTAYIDNASLSYASYNGKNVVYEDVDSVSIIIKLEDKKPVIEQAFAVKDSRRIELSKILLYKENNDVRFVDFGVETIFRNPTANKIVDLPKTKGIKFCAKSSKQVYAYDSIDNTVKLRNVVYNFAVTFPQPPPKPIESLEASDALYAENAVILSWDKSDEQNIKSFSIYYSKKPFADLKTDDIKKDNDIKRKSISIENPLEIEDIDISKCTFNPIGYPCKYSIYNKPLEKDKLYYWKSKNKFVYLVSDVEDNIEYNLAVTALDDEGNEIRNDKSIEDNTYTLNLNKNYATFTSIDDLAPDKVLNFKIDNTESGKLKLAWDKPQKNIDGSISDDIAGFNVYYKKTTLTSIAEADRIDDAYHKKSVTLQQTNCDSIVKLACDYSLEGLEKGKSYDIAVTAFDTGKNEYRADAEIKNMIVS